MAWKGASVLVRVRPWGIRVLRCPYRLGGGVARSRIYRASLRRYCRLLGLARQGVWEGGSLLGFDFYWARRTWRGSLQER